MSIVMFYGPNLQPDTGNLIYLTGTTIQPVIAYLPPNLSLTLELFFYLPQPPPSHPLSFTNSLYRALYHSIALSLT